jgi:hypothetical protein
VRWVIGPLPCFGETHDSMVLHLKLDLEDFISWQMVLRLKLDLEDFISWQIIN